jgi:hypothetical protein
MSTIDRTKPIWRVRGQLPPPDLRRMTCFVNGETEAEAIAAAKTEGMGSVSDTYLVKPDDIERWESTIVRPGAQESEAKPQ